MRLQVTIYGRMPMDASGVAERVTQELGQLGDQRVASALRKYVNTPRAYGLDWDYGPESQYPGFIVAEMPEWNAGIAYSDYGFGPAAPWILIFLDRPGFGMDSSAFTSLEGAFRDSFAWTDPSP